MLQFCKVAMSGTNFVNFVFMFVAFWFYTLFTYCSGSGAGHSLKEAGIFWSLLMIVSFLFQAADTVLKVVVYFNDCCMFWDFELFPYGDSWSFHTL